MIASGKITAELRPNLITTCSDRGPKSYLKVAGQNSIMALKKIYHVRNNALLDAFPSSVSNTERTAFFISKKNRHTVGRPYPEDNSLFVRYKPVRGRFRIMGSRMIHPENHGSMNLFNHYKILDL